MPYQPGAQWAKLELGHAQVDVWHWYLDAIGNPDDLLGALQAGEIDRYHTFPSADAARQFLAGRVLTRAALSHYANVPEREWRFTTNAHGRPSIDEPRIHRSLRFNLSHTSSIAVLAVARTAEIGIDVETTDRPVDIEWIGRSVFTQSEMRWVCAGPGGSKRDRFFDLWTLKEAYIKARGRGFSMRPDSFALATVDGQFQLQCPPDCDPKPERWRFGLWSPRPNLRVALAMGDRSVARVRTRVLAPRAGGLSGPIGERPGCEPA